jgi:hypothetical protein
VTFNSKNFDESEYVHSSLPEHFSSKEKEDNPEQEAVDSHHPEVGHADKLSMDIEEGE